MVRSGVGSWLCLLWVTVSSVTGTPVLSVDGCWTAGHGESGPGETGCILQGWMVHTERGVAGLSWPAAGAAGFGLGPCPVLHTAVRARLAWMAERLSSLALRVQFGLSVPEPPGQWDWLKLQAQG